MNEDEAALYRRRDRQVLMTRAWLYGLMLLYLSAVSANAVSLVAAFWLRIFHLVDIPYEFLAAWAIGSGGLGAGSLIFRTPLKGLFSGPM